MADLDCTWSTTYHRPGSAGRLRALDDRYELVGFTHYLKERNDGWLLSAEADAVFAVASERGLMASLAVGPAWQADLRVIARRHEDVPVLCHHLGDLRAGDDAGLGELSRLRRRTEHLRQGIRLPLRVRAQLGPPLAGRARGTCAGVFDAYGPRRASCWGSDFPASRAVLHVRQSLEAVRAHCRFLTAEDLSLAALSGSPAGSPSHPASQPAG